MSREIFISTPCYEGKVCVDYFKSMIVFYHLAAQKGWGVRFHVTTGNSQIHAARNRHVHDYMCGSYTDFVMFDSDQAYHQADPELLVKLIESPYDVVGAPVVAKDLANPPNFNVITDPRGTDVTPDGFMEVQNLGTGCMVLRRPVVEALVYGSPWAYGQGAHKGQPVPLVFYPKFDETTHLDWGEDYGLCHKVRALGYKVHCLLDAQIAHFGPFGYSANLADHNQATGAT